jgi:hypothetical protein
MGLEFIQHRQAVDHRQSDVEQRRDRFQAADGV